MGTQRSRRVALSVVTVALSSILLFGLAGFLPIALALAGNGEPGTYVVTALHQGEVCYTTGTFTPSGGSASFGWASMKGDCSETGTRLPALREWPADEVYPVSPASLMGLGLLPITISVVGLALLAIWLVLLARGTSSRHQQAETS